MQRLTSSLVLVGIFFLLLTAEAGAQLTARGGAAVELRSHHVEALVEDGLALTTLRQTFVNRGKRPLEAIYNFPLPADAALVNVAMEVGGQRLEGLLAERKRARAVYDEIVRGRRDPALVEKVGENAFRLSVFPVVPDEDTVVELTWSQRVPLEDGLFSYALPLGSDEATVARDLSLTVTLRSSVPLGEASSTRSDVYVVRRSEHEVNFSLEQQDSSLFGDVVVTAKVASDEPDLRVRTFHEGTEEGWFLALLTPPRAREEELLPRDVVLVVDTSSSMARENKLEHAKRSALELLHGLRPADRVNIVRFSSDVESFAPAPISLDDETCDRLHAFVGGFQARGSTAIGDALSVALATPRVEGRVQTIVFLTDGRPTVGVQDRAELIEIARAGGEAGLRLFTFGVGGDLDGALLRGLASAGRGSAELFRPGAEIEARLAAFLARTAAPVVADVELRVEGLDAADGIRVRDVYPRPVPDGYLGGQIALVGRYSGTGRAKVSVSGVVGGERRVLTREIDLPRSSEGVPVGSPTVKHLYARQRLERLEEALRLRNGLSDEAYYAALDRGAYASQGELVQELIDVSATHGVQCAYTSFLVLLPEDRARLDPQDLEGLTAALERARDARGGAAAVLGAEFEEEVLEEPVLKDSQLAMPEESTGDPDFPSGSPFDSQDLDDIVGIGGGAGGKFGGRLAGRRNLSAAGNPEVEASLRNGLERLASLQLESGAWPAAAASGDPSFEATTMVLVALLGDGHTTVRGALSDHVTRGLVWLRSQQDPSSGTFTVDGSRVSLRLHVVATHVLAEAYYFGKSPVLKRRTQLALDYLIKRLPKGEAKLRREGDGFAGWVALTLFVAREGGFDVPDSATSSFIGLLDSVVGLGPIESDTPALVAARILSLLLLEDPVAGRGEPVDASGLADLLAQLAQPSLSGGTVDLETAFLASCALTLQGGEPLELWKQRVPIPLAKALERTLADAATSSEPTKRAALLLLCLEGYYRLRR